MTSALCSYLVVLMLLSEGRTADWITKTVPCSYIPYIITWKTDELQMGIFYRNCVAATLHDSWTCLCKPSHSPVSQIITI